MIRFLTLFFLTLISFSDVAGNHYRGKDSANIYQKIDTTCIEDCGDWLNAKMVAVVRTNKFSVKDKVSGQTLEYSINNNINMGLGVSFKGIGLEFQYNPPGLNNDDLKYGKSKQFAISTSANSRRFIYDIYYRSNQGFHTTATYNFTGDTSKTADYVRRGDITNYSAGFNVLYIFNNKRFSSSAPYNLTQRQKKSVGSMLSVRMSSFSLTY